MLTKGNSIYANIITECRSLISALVHPPVQNIFREANGVADCLPKHAARISTFEPPTLLPFPPAAAQEAIDIDNSDTIFVTRIKLSTIDLPVRGVVQDSNPTFGTIGDSFFLLNTKHML